MGLGRLQRESAIAKVSKRTIYGDIRYDTMAMAARLPTDVRHTASRDCMTSWVLLRHPGDGHLGWFL